jgi:hypothetical protein
VLLIRTHPKPLSQCAEQLCLGMVIEKINVPFLFCQAKGQLDSGSYVQLFDYLKTNFGTKHAIGAVYRVFEQRFRFRIFANLLSILIFF